MTKLIAFATPLFYGAITPLMRGLRRFPWEAGGDRMLRLF